MDLLHLPLCTLYCVVKEYLNRALSLTWKLCHAILNAILNVLSDHHML